VKKILVTGSEGMLGSALMRALPKAGLLPEGADIRSKKNRADLTQPDETKEIISKIRPDIIIHTAAYTDVDGCEISPDKAYAVNGDGVRNVSEASKEIGSFVIYISTDFVFDGNKGKSYTEEDRTNPISVYGKSKLKGEDFIRATLDNYLIIRTSWLFGKNGKNFVDTIIQKTASERILKVVEDQKGTPTFVDDLAKAISNLISQNIIGQGLGILNITNSGSCSWYEFAKEIINEKGLGSVVAIEPISSDMLDKKARRPKLSVLDNRSFAKIYGKKLPSWQDGLSRYISSTKTENLA